MPEIFIDIETRSRVDLAACGVWKYAQDCEVIAACWAVDDGPVQRWCSTDDAPPPAFQPGARYVAHNAAFERVVLHHCWGWPLEPENWWCTQVQASAHGYPASLEEAGRFAGLAKGEAKMAEGKALIRRFSTPPFGKPLEHLEEWLTFIEYCARDVEACRALYKRLPKINLGPEEHALWCLDQRINDRGFAVDLDLARAAMAACESEKEQLDAQIAELTHGAITSGTQRERIFAWLNIHGCDIPDTTKATMEKAAAGELAADLRTIIEVRQRTARSSVAKYQRALEGAVAGRLHHTMQFAGAGRTARWAGRRFQPQNMPRPTMKWQDIYEGIEQLKLGFAFATYDDIHDLAANALRSTIIAPEGKALAVADWLAVEGRGLAWLAGEQWKLDAYAEGRDMYIETYCKAFAAERFEKKDPRRQVGKVLDLSMGYAGGVGAILAMSGGYRVDPAEMARGAWAAASPEVRDRALYLWDWAGKNDRRHDLTKPVYCGLECAKLSWRNASPATVKFWDDMEKAAVNAVLDAGKPYRVGKIAFLYKPEPRTLLMRLPSKRCLFYFQPRLKEDDLAIGRMSLTVLDPRYGRQPLLKGTIVENATQAMCRDLLAYALPRVEDMTLMGQKVYDVILHTHDEIVAEVSAEMQRADSHADVLAEVMCELPPWARGMPIAAEGFTTVRYRKED